MERYPERPIRRSPETHELNVARRIEGGPYHLELAPEFQGAIMFHLHGIRSRAVRLALPTVAADVQVFDVSDDDAFLYIPFQHTRGEFQSVTRALGREVESLEAYPVVEVRRGEF